MKVLIGEAYVSDGVWLDTVIATDKDQPVDPELASMMFRNIREKTTSNNYKADELFVD